MSGAPHWVLTLHLFLPPLGRPVSAAEGRSLVPYQLPFPGSTYPSYLQSKSQGMGVGAIQGSERRCRKRLSGAQSERVVSGRNDGDYVGDWLCIKETEWLPGDHSINLYHGAQWFGTVAV
jgi:hypothetical protein